MLLAFKKKNLTCCFVWPSIYRCETVGNRSVIYGARDACAILIALETIADFRFQIAGFFFFFFMVRGTKQHRSTFPIALQIRAVNGFSAFSVCSISGHSVPSQCRPRATCVRVRWRFA